MGQNLGRLIISAADRLWGGPNVILLFSLGVYLTLRYRFIQIRWFLACWNSLSAGREHRARGVLTQFQAFATAVGATVGIGNIAGIATALVSGGPGSVFWMWFYGFFATVIKFTEASLGLRFRILENETDRVRSGPMYYLRDGLNSPFLAAAFALAAGIGELFTTPFTQPNSMAVVLQSQFRVAPMVSGVLIALLTGIVIMGGIGVIGRVAERFTPLKIGIYLIGGILVIGRHYDQVLGAFASIFRDAFSLHSIGGGSLGIGMIRAMRYGVSRGVNANEAGIGTAAVAYGTARSKEPSSQGLAAMLEVIIVTFVISSVTALVILTSGVLGSGATSTALVAQAFDTALPKGGWLLALCTCLIGYSTLLSCAFYGEQFFEYLLGFSVAIPYRCMFCVLIFFGAIIRVETLWAWGDILIGVQLLPNIVGIVALSGLVARDVRHSKAPV